MEIALQVDEAQAIIKDVQIASDCLEPEEIQKAEVLLRGCSTRLDPLFDPQNKILNDIVHLIYE